MKKAYIITFYNELNYGAVLQAFSLKEYLKENEYNTFFLGTNLNSFQNNRKNNFIINIMYKCLNSKKRNNFNTFFKNEFQVEYENLNYTNLLKKKPSCDLLVCGSDQIWNPNITNGIQPYYYGVGINANKKIAYAASCGNFNVLEDYIEILKGYLSGFDGISLREKTTSDFLKIHSIDNINVVDPTLLINKKKWDYLVSKSKISKDIMNKQYIFVYDLEGTELFSNKVNQLAEKTGMEIISLRRRAHYIHNDLRFYDASPYDFLFFIKYATLVVSNSYHALLFSYIFEKNILTIAHTKYPERMQDFMAYFNKSFVDGDIDVNFKDNKSDILINKIKDSKKFLEKFI